MSGLSNYPPGVSDFTPGAPWNQPDAIEGRCHVCGTAIEGYPNERAQYPEIVFDIMCPECEDVGLCGSCATKIEDEEITPPCVTREPDCHASQLKESRYEL